MVFTGPQDTMEKELRNTILFNAYKKEVFTTNTGYKSMQKRLRSNWKIQSLKDEITSEKLIGVKLWISAGPREKFTAAELEVLKKFLDGGGDILVMLGEGGESRFDTNINFLLEEYGIMVNNGKLAELQGRSCLESLMRRAVETMLRLLPLSILLVPH